MGILIGRYVSRICLRLRVIVWDNAQLFKILRKTFKRNDLVGPTHAYVLGPKSLKVFLLKYKFDGNLILLSSKFNWIYRCVI